MLEFNCLENGQDSAITDGLAGAKWAEAQFYRPDPDLILAMQVAISMRQPLLLTGEPGCGKTSAPYAAARRLGLTPDDLFHIQIRSDSTAAKLKYDFDAVRYLRESQIAALNTNRDVLRPASTPRSPPTSQPQLAGMFNNDLERFFQKGLLWSAFEASQRRRVILLVDEIDKAPRDLPNDLLREFDSLEFEIPEWPEADGKPRIVRGQYGDQPGIVLIVFTSNGERQLPDAFLRRCLHHYLSFGDDWIREIVNHRIKMGDIKIAPTLLEHAIKRFITLKYIHELRHPPSLSEFLVWLKIISMVGNIKNELLLNVPLGKLPYIGALIKDPKDLALIKRLSE